MHFEKARAGWLKTNNFGALSVVLNNIGIIYQRLGQYDLALDTLRSGLGKARETGYRRVEAGTLISIADILRDLGEHKDALSTYQEGQEIARQVMESSLVAYATSGIGETYRLQGEREKADILLKEAFHQAQDQQQPYEAALFSIPIGIIEYERGRFENAENILLDASQRLETIGDKDALAKAYYHLAQNSFLSKKYDTAIKWLEKTSRLADELGYEDFLVIEGRNAIPLVQYGSEKAVGGIRFSGVLERINSIRKAESVTNSTVGFSSGPETKRRSDIEVKTLGQSCVRVNNRQLDDADWRSQRAKEIFFYLLTFQSGRTREQIAADLWPDLSPSKASSNFHINLFRARQALYPGIFVFENNCYQVNPNLHISFDALEFEKLLDGIDTPSSLISSLSNVEKAIRLYNGAFLKELNGEWIEVRRRELENIYIKALSLLVDHYEKKGEYGKATTFLEKLIAIDPYDEDVYYTIMRSYIAEKNSPMALYAYKRYAEIVNSSVEPGIPADIRELQQRILASAPLIHQRN
jgi:two-component SAPR family response regulator